MCSGFLTAVCWVMCLIVWQIATNVSENQPPPSSLYPFPYWLCYPNRIINQTNKQISHIDDQPSNAAQKYRYVLQIFIFVFVTH
jgi:hypothetical protein